MRYALSIQTAEAIRADLAEGLSQRAIAKRRGVSLGTVSRIATNRWVPPDPERLTRVVLHDDPHHDARRCPTCGGLIYLWPCLRCHIHGAERKVAKNSTRISADQ